MWPHSGAVCKIGLKETSERARERESERERNKKTRKEKKREMHSNNSVFSDVAPT
jgi:hypothetical protein